MKIHDLKTWPPYFEQVVRGNKTFEVRKNDRNFKVGDVLCLREWHPESEGYTGRVRHHGVPYILYGGKLGVDADTVVMALGPVPWEAMDAVMKHMHEQ